MVSDRDFYETAYHFDDDVIQVDEPRMARALDLLEPLAAKTFVDLGSGVGWAARFALQRGAGATLGLDFAIRALLLGQQGIPEVSRVQADGCQLPIRSGSIDRLLSFGSIEHFPDVSQGLREIARVLAPDGRAVIVVPNFYVRTEQPRELRLSQGRWTRLINDAGLRVDAVRADFGPPVFRDRRPARILFRGAAKLLGFVPRMQYQFVFALAPARVPSSTRG
jgi:SAM-dependent methyltransferase